MVLIQIYIVALAIPISLATCERSYSSMRTINTYLRSNTEQDRFKYYKHRKRVI